MSDKAEYKNRINVFYVTTPPEEDNDPHIFVNTMNITEPKKKVHVSLYTELFNLDESENLYTRIRYSISDKDNNKYSDFTKPLKVKKGPNPLFTSLKITAEFVLEIDHLICFNIELLKISKSISDSPTSDDYEILDSKQCYANVYLSEAVDNEN